MKYLYLLLLFSSFTFGQNVELLKKLNGTDSISTIEITEKIFEGFKIEPYTKYDSIDQNFSGKLIYRLKNSEGKTVKIQFQTLTRNGNSDLNIKGEDYFVFENAEGKFLDMFPFWEKEVQPGATTEKTYDKNPIYVFEDKELKIRLSFRRTNSGIWQLRNLSSYL